MRRFLLSLVVGLFIGAGAGLVLGWVVFPVQYIDSPLYYLRDTYKQEYTVMVAAGFRLDGDIVGALDRLRVLKPPAEETWSAPDWIQAVTELYISQGRDVAKIRNLVALSEAVGRLTPMMEPFRAEGTP